MKKIVFLSFLVLFAISINSQEVKNGRITYDVFVKLDEKAHLKFMSDPNIPQERKDTRDEMYLNNKTVKAVLSFNQKSSLYEVKEEKREDGFNLSRMISGGKSLYYSNFEEDFYYYTFSDPLANESLLISYDQMKWKITTETKTIQGYLCYKAIEINEKKKEKQIAIAWFTKELPYQIGPRDYGGLPGMILEIHENKRRFLANKIEVNLSKMRIAPPLEGRGITRKEFNEKYKNFFKN